MVAVQNAQRVSQAPSLLKTSTEATPIDPDIFQGFGTGDEFAATGRREEIDLDLDGDSDPPEGRPEVTAIPAAWSASAVMTPP
jgi:hypothetical protein